MASPAVLAALAVPARHAVLTHLMNVGAQTASECAVAVGITASNASWHLRALAKIGLVERDDSETADRRTRPWRAAVTGLRFAPPQDAAETLAQRAARSVAAAESDAAFADYLEHEDEVARKWRAAATDHEYAVQATPDELAEIGRRIDDIVRPFVRPTRADTPDDAGLARITVRAYVDRRRSTHG